MTLNELIKLRKRELPNSVPFRELEDLIGHCTEKTWGEIQLIKHSFSIKTEQRETFERLFKQLKSGVPLAYVLGEKYFYKSIFKVTPAVLIPRSETEILVEMALSELTQKGAVVFDLGAGSGCIGLSIAQERPQSKVYLFEASSEALEICRENSQRLDLKNTECVEAIIGESDVNVLVKKGDVDLIVANPPYIPFGDGRVQSRVSQFEPHQALYAKDNGLFWIHKWLLWGYDYLRTGGVYIFEFGQGQEAEILPLIQEQKFHHIELVCDYSGNNRFYKLIK